MENKEIKVGSFVTYENPYDSIDRVTHGSERYYMGHCLVEYNNELYLADTLEEVIDTDEGAGYCLSGMMRKHNYVSEILQELGIPMIGEARTNIDYILIDGLRKINKKGELTEDIDFELERKIKDYSSITISTNDENYMQYDDYMILINPNLEETIKDDLNIDVGYDTVIVSKDNIPYGDINASIELIGNKILLHMDEKEYVLERFSRNTKETTLNNTVISEEKKQELLKILNEQQAKIKSQENELANLREQRRKLNEK